MSVTVEIDVQGIAEFAEAMRKFDLAMQERVRSQVNEWAQMVKAEAERIVPVKTGYLRSTIFARMQELVAEVGAEAAYAYCVELGTRYMQARPFIQPALQQHLPTLETLIVQAIDMAKTEATM